jgi:hypothetical protein
MAKKNRVSELDLPPVEIVVAPMPELPTETVVNATIAKVTGKKNPPSKPSEKKKPDSSSSKPEKSLKTQKISPSRHKLSPFRRFTGGPKRKKVPQEKNTPRGSTAI